MANSQDPQAHRKTYHPGKVAARTPGSLGRNDQADPCVCSYLGDTPGSLGVNDGGSEVADGEGRSAQDPNQTYKLMLLDKRRVAGFLRSVIYLQLTSDMIKLQTERMGLVFTTTTVDTGDEKEKDRKVDELLPDYMKEFGYASYCEANSKLVDKLVAEHPTKTVFATPTLAVAASGSATKQPEASSCFEG